MLDQEMLAKVHQLWVDEAKEAVPVGEPYIATFEQACKAYASGLLQDIADGDDVPGRLDDLFKLRDIMRSFGITWPDEEHPVP